MHIKGSPSHSISWDLNLIALHIRHLYPTSSPSYFISWGVNPIALHCISGSLTHITPYPRVFTPFISRDLYLDAYLNISIHCIIAFKHNQHVIISMIHLGLPRPLQVSFAFRAPTPTPGLLSF